MKKVLFIVPQLSHGGSNKSLESMLSKLDSSIFEIRVYSLETNEQDSPYYGVFLNLLIAQGMIYRIAVGVKLIRKALNAIQNFLKIGVWRYVYQIEADRIQKKENFDIVVGFEESYATVFASRFFCAKRIAWMHCDYNLYKIYSGGRDEHALYAKFDQIVAVSKFAAEVFCENFPEARDKTCVIYNLLDVENIKSLAAAQINDYRFKTDVFTIVSVGRISEVKQFQLIPDFIKEIKKKDNKIQFRWYIIGDGDEYLKNAIYNKIGEYGIQDCLVLLGAKKNPYPYIKKSDLLVCTSRTESWSYVINEAKVLNTPVVTLRCGSSKEVVEEGVSGFIVDTQDLSCRLLSLMRDREIYAKLKSSLFLYRYENEIEVNKIQNILNAI